MSPHGTTSRALRAMHDGHTRRDPWPAFDEFKREAYPLELRQRTARQWWRRAHAEYGSVHEFSQVLHALTCINAPMELTGALARLITDEARHVQLCTAMALALVPDDTPEWKLPQTPYPSAPTGESEIIEWAAGVVACACCIGETLSRPLYDCLAMLITDPVPESVVRQILRDEHLHAKFGWELLPWLLERLDDAARARFEVDLSCHLAGYESSSSAGVRLEDIVNVELVVEEAAPDAPPNLGLMPREVYGAIFYATLEGEVLPAFERAGVDGFGAWRRRGERSR